MTAIAAAVVFAGVGGYLAVARHSTPEAVSTERIEEWVAERHRLEALGKSQSEIDAARAPFIEMLMERNR